MDHKQRDKEALPGPSKPTILDNDSSSDESSDDDVARTVPYRTPAVTQAITKLSSFYVAYQSIDNQVPANISSHVLWFRELAGYSDAYATQHMMLTMTLNHANEWKSRRGVANYFRDP